MDNGDHIRALLYSYFTTTTGLGTTYDMPCSGGLVSIQWEAFS